MGIFTGAIDGHLEEARVIESRSSLVFVAFWSSAKGYRWATADISGAVKSAELGLLGRCTHVRMPSGRPRLFSVINDREAAVAMHGDTAWIVSPDKGMSYVRS